ncbi:hypothetical protein BH11CYA1_BH11CYA1_06680 [soil metagenome]
MKHHTLPTMLGRDTHWLVKIDGKFEVIATGAIGNRDGSAQGFFLPGIDDFYNLDRIEEVVRPITIDESLPPRPDDFCPPPASLWFVVVECRYNVVKVSDCGLGFYIPGQEPCWLLPHVDEWLQQIHPQSQNQRII